MQIIQLLRYRRDFFTKPELILDLNTTGISSIINQIRTVYHLPYYHIIYGFRFPKQGIYVSHIGTYNILDLWNFNYLYVIL